MTFCHKGVTFCHKGVTEKLRKKNFLSFLGDFGIAHFVLDAYWMQVPASSTHPVRNGQFQNLPKKTKSFFSLTFLSRPCDKTSRPCDKTSRPPPIFVTFMSRPCDKTSRPCDKTSRPLPIFHFFWSQDCDKTSRPFTPPQSFERVLSNFCIARLRQNVTPL